MNLVKTHSKNGIRISRNKGEIKKYETFSNHSSLRSVYYPSKRKQKIPFFQLAIYYVPVKFELIKTIAIPSLIKIKKKIAVCILLISSDFVSYLIHLTPHPATFPSIFDSPMIMKGMKKSVQYSTDSYSRKSQQRYPLTST